ncbi:MAG TPA: nucleoside hydrolase [Paenirhodobacter sp.]
MALKLLIDTDPGIDDAMAILFAARHPGIDLVGLTTVFGNVYVADATRNALALTERAGHAIPVAEGAAQPLVLPPFTPPAHIHGISGFGSLPAPVPSGRKADETAAELLCRLARENPGELVVCPVGPITNIAEAIRLDPAFSGNVAKIVIMGGACHVRGNISPFAEANTWHDPHALAEVFASGADVTMVGLDVTMKAFLDRADFDALSRQSPGDGVFLRDLSDFYLKFYNDIGFDGCALHDAMAVIACLKPEWFTIEDLPMEVVTTGEEIGRTRPRADGTGPVIHVCTDCDADAIKNYFLSVF